ncbi:MAG: PLP-dependent aminotransferase family protein [Anaerolineales bacterium]|nr:PLP-dependent aminotransferase family protein [Anaerolineales bacterium]
MQTSWEHRYAGRTQQIQSSAIREILKFTQDPEVISFAGGLPAPDAFPIDAIRAAAETVLTEIGPTALQYSLTEGVVELRELIAEMAAEQGFKVGMENILITSGSQQALDLLGKVFINRGDYIVTDSPSYLGALQAFNVYGVRYIAVPMDDEGMMLEPLEDALRASPKFIYLVPNFHNPTGVTISYERRMRILDLAFQYGVPVVEDDPYGKLRYEGEHIPPMVALDAIHREDCQEQYCGNVLYMSTFSKTLAPGLRMAWVIAPAEVIRKMVQAKQGADLHSPTLNQYIAFEAARNGFLDQYIQKIKALYGEHRLVMLQALEEHFPASVKWTKPQGGMFLWVTLPEGMDAAKLLPKAVARKVAFVPGAPFHPNGGGENTMRLNFSNSSPDLIRKGIAQLGQVLKAELG